MNITAKEAYKYLIYAKEKNNGKWINHSWYVGQAAGKLASHMRGCISVDIAMGMGYIHDIGRMFGDMKISHALKGYYFLKEQGYEESAKICLTHSFPVKDVKTVTGLWDCSDNEYDFLKEYIATCKYDYYDKLIQLCDNMATAEGIVTLEMRLVDIVMRYGWDNDNTMNRWQKIFELKKEIEFIMGKSVEDILGLKKIIARDYEYIIY